MEKEIFKDIPGYEGLYKISKSGVVISKRKSWSEKNHFIVTGGYQAHDLWKNNKRKHYTTHQLVAMAYLNHIPSKYTIVVDHIDNDKSNNHVSNLQLVTPRVNNSKDKKNKTSKYTGVYYDKSHKKFRSDIRVKGKGIYLGRFDTPEEAHQAYMNKLKEIEHIKKTY